jgi:hypothetical protein
MLGELGRSSNRSHAQISANPDGAFIAGSDVLVDGVVTASYFYGERAPER